MKKINSISDDYLFKSEDGYITAKFKLGDIVRVVDAGYEYSTYKNAFEFFKILNKTKKIGDFYRLEYDYDFDTNWIVCGIGIHGHSHDIVYHIINKKKQHMIIGEGGLENRNIIRNENNPLSMKNKNLFVYKIPKSYD